MRIHVGAFPLRSETEKCTTEHTSSLVMLAWVSSNVRRSATRTHVASLRTTTPPGCHDMMLREYQDVVAMEPKNVVMHRSKVSMPHSLDAAQ